MRVDERDHGFDRRSSSAIAKYADALRRISLAWRSSRFSRSSALIRACSALVGPVASRSRSACRTHLRSVSPSSRSSRRSIRSLPTARHDRPRAPTPSAPLARGLQAHTEPMFSASPSPHPLKDRSLRETRSGSWRPAPSVRQTPKAPRSRLLNHSKMSGASLASYTNSEPSRPGSKSATSTTSPSSSRRSKNLDAIFVWVRATRCPLPHINCVMRTVGSRPALALSRTTGFWGPGPENGPAESHPEQSSDESVGITPRPHPALSAATGGEGAMVLPESVCQAFAMAGAGSGSRGIVGHGCECPALGSWLLQKSQVERGEHQDDSYVHHQPFP